VTRRLAVAALALASIAGSAAAESPEPLRLVWTDPARAALGVDALARDEAGALLRRMGLSASWRRGDANEIARPGEVRVILLDRGTDQAPGIPVLGATPSRFEGAPFVWVHVPNVRAAAGLRPGGTVAAVDPASARALGIALGRVVAHELVHALAPSVPHGTGLMSAKLTRRQLTAATLPVDPEVGLAVQAAMRGEPSLPRAVTATLAAATAGQEDER
jgi:hypothetical protein